MPDQADELARLQTAVETLSTQVAQLEQRMIALERGRNVTFPPAPAPVQPPPQQLESRLGLTIVNRIGAITLAIGIVFFFKYAADNQWIGASGRVVLGLLSGLILIGVADWLRRRDQRVFSQGVADVVWRSSTSRSMHASATISLSRRQQRFLRWSLRVAWRSFFRSGMIIRPLQLSAS
jgi:hypothetical protein